LSAVTGVANVEIMKMAHLGMLFRKSFQFRLRPTKKQARALEAQLGECRWLYNELLEERKLAYEEFGKNENEFI